MLALFIHILFSVTDVLSYRGIVAQGATGILPPHTSWRGVSRGRLRYCRVWRKVTHPP